MSAPTIQVENAKEIRKTFRATGDKELPKALRAAHKRVSELVVAEALPNVPERTGALRRTVKALATQTSAYGKAGSAAVPYAQAVHWGTGPRPGLKGPHNIRRAPFLLNAAERITDDATALYLEAVQEILDGAIR